MSSAILHSTNTPLVPQLRASHTKSGHSPLPLLTNLSLDILHHRLSRNDPCNDPHDATDFWPPELSKSIPELLSSTIRTLSLSSTKSHRTLPCTLRESQLGPAHVPPSPHPRPRLSRSQSSSMCGLPDGTRSLRLPNRSRLNYGESGSCLAVRHRRRDEEATPGLLVSQEQKTYR